MGERTLQFVKALENSDQKLLADLLTFSDNQALSEIKDTLDSNNWILPRVCELGFLDVLQSIYDLQLVDINAEHKGKTGLQYACQEGHAEVVKWLLSHEASLKKSLWTEDSEFYLATVNGKMNIVDILVSRHPDLATDISICYCLMYAASCGGHLELVKRWYLPGIDVRETIAYTTDLNNCEHKYPLFAACHGKHFEVAKFLIEECGAAITQDICQHFPEFTTQLVRFLYLKSYTKHFLEFYMANYKIECILPCWFSVEKRNQKTPGVPSKDDDDADDEEETLFEITIDVKENRMRMLPDGVLWTLRELVLLNASYNPLGTVADALDPSSLALNRLRSLNLSHCQLETLSSHIFALPCLEQLDLSYNKLTFLGNAVGKSTDWKCTRLTSLDASHNLLTSFPPGIPVCAELTTLDLSYNQLNSCNPWQCPMKTLDLSHNKLTAFAPSADQFWKQTLKRLLLQSNEITELTESIVKMRILTYLDVSDNKIQRMPLPNLWCCPLMFFNINDNQLGASKLMTPLQKVISLSNTAVQQIEFPKSCLASTMMELFIANNDLKTVPNGIGDLNKLCVLDLSENVKITELPPELGKLKKLLHLKLIGITVKDKELQSLISSLDDTTKNVFACDVINYLECQRRNCVHPDILKIVVLGCKNKHGLCIVQKLANIKVVNLSDHENLTVIRMTSKQKKSLTYDIWEVPDIKVTPAILPCFLTLNSLYIIVHDVLNYGADLHSVSEKVSSIHACVLRPKIIVVCAYSKSMEKSARENVEKKIMIQSFNGFQRAKFISVMLGAKENVDSLHQEIYSAWKTMNDAIYEKDVKLHQRQVPKMFLDVVSTVRKWQQDICRMDDFLEAAGCSRKDLEDGMNPKLKLHEFLLQVGVMLHYNIDMGELSDCVILNPSWLFKVLLKFLKSLTQFAKIAQVSISAVKASIQDELPEGDYDYFPAFIKILETFNIGIRITDSTNKKDEFILVPSLLPKQPPQFQLDAHTGSCKAARLYCLPSISPALWSHVISQLILAFERFSSSKWKLGEQRSTASATIDRTKSFRIGCATSLKGLNIYNKNIQYWRTGIMMHYDQGHVAVEQVTCNSGTEKPEPGILVTVQTTGSLLTDFEMEQLNDNTKKLSVMGIVRDELEEILELFNPKFRDASEAQMKQIYALCPLCQNIKPGSGYVNLDQIHFKIRDCAQVLLSRDAMICSKGPTLLAHLVPEFLFLELPPELHLSEKDIVLSDVKLGHGVAGVVTKGTYKGRDVALKVFHDSTLKESSDSQEDSLYPNVAFAFDQDSQSAFTRQEQDAQETEQIKISNAFSDVRREVGILSKLKHEFIVTFIGLCVRPQLLLVMELAPYGSLRRELERKIRSILHELEHPDTILSQMIFSKDFTYKIILQIGSGLSYLHKNNVIYRDLKPDNILVFSLSSDDRVNIKLSDYGISKFFTPHGVTGLSGTAGYMAPEVVAQQPYTEQADIYSYAIVMLEVLTGLPPTDQLHRHGFSHLSGNEKAPSHVQGRTILSDFPYLQYLMEECWSLNMDERPTAENVVKRMKADHFLLLHDSIWLGKSFLEKLEATCIYSHQTVGRWNIWICESGIGNHRYFSVYDVMSCSFTVHRQQCDGPQVTDMTKVGSRIWVVCKELNNLQVIVRGTQNKFEICHGVSLEAKATKILNHTFGTSEESDSFILVGHENGCVTAYHFNTCHKKSVTVITNIELHGGTPVAQMCSVNFGVIAVACGMSIHLLHLGLPESRGADEARKNGTFISELVNNGSVSLRSILTNYDPVVSMVAEGNAVWCSLESSSLLVKVDVNNKNIVLVLNLIWDPLRDTVIIDEMDNGSHSQIRNLTSKFTKHDNSRDEDDNVFSETCNFSKTTKASDNDNAGSEYSLPLRHSVGECCKTDDHNTSENKPPVPPRVHPKLRRETENVPSFDTQKPPVPKRVLGQEVTISITSLGLSEDILIAGTSCGGIILLPLNYKHHSDTSGSLPGLPISLPLLRHPSKKKEQGTRSKSFTAFSSEQTLNSTGSISALVLSNTKLVSLHIVQRHVLRDCSRNRSKVATKRLGSVFTAQSTETLNAQGLSYDENPLNNTGCSDSPGPPSATLTDQMQSEVADIAVWDNITRQRLKTVRSYSHQSYKCFGWCCHAPD